MPCCVAKKQNKNQVATIAIKGTGAENLVSLHWSGCSCVGHPQLQGKLGDIIFSRAMCFAKSPSALSSLFYLLFLLFLSNYS